MITKLPEHLQALVETICANGCEHVNIIIAAISQKQAIEEINHLSDSEQKQVLDALINIMSVYDEKL